MAGRSSGRLGGRWEEMTRAKSFHFLLSLLEAIGEKKKQKAKKKQSIDISYLPTFHLFRGLPSAMPDRLVPRFSNPSTADSYIQPVTHSHCNANGLRSGLFIQAGQLSW